MFKKLMNPNDGSKHGHWRPFAKSKTKLKKEKENSSRDESSLCSAVESTGSTAIVSQSTAGFQIISRGKVDENKPSSGIKTTTNNNEEKSRINKVIQRDKKSHINVPDNREGVVNNSENCVLNRSNITGVGRMQSSENIKVLAAPIMVISPPHGSSGTGISQVKKPQTPTRNKSPRLTKSDATSPVKKRHPPEKYTVKLLKSNVSDRTWLITPDERKTYKTLDLRKAKLSQIPSSVLQLRGFQAVRLSCNYELSNVRELGHMGALKIVDLKRCGIKSFSDTGIGLNKLKALELSNNKCMTDFGDLKTLPHLQHLSIAGCSLHTIPTEVFSLTKLQVLVLDNNPFDEIVFDLSPLVDLQVLLISNCGFSRIPSSIFTLRELMYLSVAENNIPLIPDDIAELPALKVINAFDNRNLAISPTLRANPMLKKIQVDENFDTERVPRKMRRVIEVWKKIPTAWWKHV